MPKSKLLVMMLLVVVMNACSSDPIVVDPTRPPLAIYTIVPQLVPTETPLPSATQVSTEAAPSSIPPTATPSPIPTSIPPTEVAVAEVSSSGIVLAEGNGLRLRELPSLNANILDLLPEDSSVTVMGRNADGTWLQVITPSGQAGWVFAEYVEHSLDLNLLTIPEEAFAPTPQSFTPPTTNSAANGAITGITSTSSQIFLNGQRLGNRAGVFSKVGDSITDTGHFMYPFGWGTHDLHEYSYYQSAVNFFLSTNARDGNSFRNRSMAARSGWKTTNLLNPADAQPGICNAGEIPLVCEYRVVRPSIALIMIGSNDLPDLSVADFEANLRQITQITVDMGVIPVLSTIPYRQYWEAKTDQFNQVITNMARAFDVPLWDYGGAMRNLPNQGLDADGLHPSWVGAEYGNFNPSGNFTAENLTHGFPLRNLMGLQVLDAMWRQVIAPNSGNAVPVTDNLNIAPAVSNRPPASCPGAPPFRLQVGQSGRVTPGDANNLRAQGASNAQIVGTLRGGDTFAVVGGPTCSGGMTYWQVNHNGQVGWTAEGTNTSYWLEPTN